MIYYRSSQLVKRSKIMKNLYSKYKLYCYIANAKTKRDWLIRGHVALDKCNVSPRETSKKLLPGCEYKKTKWRRNSQV